MEGKPLVSIIVPVYNAEAVLYTALASIAKQHYVQLEIILINDCSTDKTSKIITEFKPVMEEKGMIVKVISHYKNKGVAVARNTGLEHATGEYIYYVDADDRIEPDAIKLLVKEAVSNKADIVGCNWFLTFEKNERKMNQASFANPIEAIQKMLNGSMRWNLWLFMVRRSLYVNNQITFIPQMNMGEDMMVMVKLFIKSARVTYLDEALYHYGQSNDQSLTKVYSDAHIREVTTNVAEVERSLLQSVYSDQIGDGLTYLKLNIKLPLLISDQDKHYQRWLTWFPESNDKVLQNKALPLRTTFLQWMAVKKQFWAIKVYYRLVIRFVYGKLYK